MKNYLLSVLRSIYAWYSESVIVDLENHKGEELANFVCRSLMEQTEMWSMKGGVFAHQGGTALLVRSREIVLMSRDAYLNDGAVAPIRTFDGPESCRIREHLDRWIAKSLFFPKG
jgi:hypothetical protein